MRGKLRGQYTAAEERKAIKEEKEILKARASAKKIKERAYKEARPTEALRLVQIDAGMDGATITSLGVFFGTKDVKAYKKLTRWIEKNLKPQKFYVARGYPLGDTEIYPKFRVDKESILEPDAEAD